MAQEESAVVVTVMQVRVMRMAVPQAAVLMLVAVRLAAVPSERVLVPVMLVVHVLVVVRHLLMDVRVLVALRQVQPDAEGHEGRSDPERRGRRLGKDQERNGGAEEWCH